MLKITEKINKIKKAQTKPWMEAKTSQTDKWNKKMLKKITD